jgi:hypothetical protein
MDEYEGDALELLDEKFEQMEIRFDDMYWSLVLEMKDGMI